MTFLRHSLAATLLVASFGAVAQSCIVAGRVSDGRWAPRLAGVQLLGDNGRVIRAASPDALAGVRQARLARPALLSRCDGAAALAQADHEPPLRREPVPALSAGVVEVEAVSFPKLRTGGALVELKVRAPAQRVVMLTK